MLGNLTTFRQIEVLRYSFAGARKGAYPGPQGPVAQLVSAPPCHGGGRGFESRRGRVSGDGSITESRPGSSVGSSVRLKSERSPVRFRPWPPATPTYADFSSAPLMARILGGGSTSPTMAFERRGPK
jgi:hypothetical protein